MSKSNFSENAYVGLVFNATTINGLAENDTTSPNTSLFLALHTADPGEAGDQTTSEATYTSYARVGVLRSGAGWTVSGDSASNAALVQFPQCTGGTNTITHVSIGLVTSGASEILYSGALNASLAVSNLIQPQFAIGALVVTEA